MYVIVSCDLRDSIASTHQFPVFLSLVVDKFGMPTAAQVMAEQCPIGDDLSLFVFG